MIKLTTGSKDVPVGDFLQLAAMDHACTSRLFDTCAYSARLLCNFTPNNSTKYMCMHQHNISAPGRLAPLALLLPPIKCSSVMLIHVHQICMPYVVGNDKLKKLIL